MSKEDAVEKSVKGVETKLKQMKILREKVLNVSKGNFDRILVFYGSIIGRLLEQLIQSFYLLWILGFTKESEEIIDNKDGTTTTNIIPPAIEKQAALEIYTSCMLTGMFMTIMLCPLIGYLADTVNFTF